MHYGPMDKWQSLAHIGMNIKSQSVGNLSKKLTDYNNIFWGNHQLFGQYDFENEAVWERRWLTEA